MSNPGLVSRFLTREIRHHLNSTKEVAVDNPFIPRLNPETGRWRPPRVSLRRQKELVKEATKIHQLHLLPPGPKLKPREIPPWPSPTPSRSQTRSKKGPLQPQKMDILDVLSNKRRIDWIGEVKVRQPTGSNVGNRLYAGKWRMFKGKKWQRVYKRRKNYQRILMSDMARRIRKFRLYRLRQSPNPLQPILGKVGKSRFLPF